jgi:hypothetical protein
MIIADRDQFSTAARAPKPPPPLPPLSPLSTLQPLLSSLVQTSDCTCLCECKNQPGYVTLAPKLLAGSLKRINDGSPKSNPPQLGCKHFASCALNGTKCN